MLLSGDLIMEHEGHHTCRLRPLMQDAFWGDWNTTSHGQCVDFNLMTRPEVTGDLMALCLGEQAFRILEQGAKMVLFAYLGDMIFQIERQEVPLPQGDTLVLNANQKQELDVTVRSQNGTACLVAAIIRDTLSASGNQELTT